MSTIYTSIILWSDTRVVVVVVVVHTVDRVRSIRPGVALPPDYRESCLLKCRVILRTNSLFSPGAINGSTVVKLHVS